jgi:hypothetical protein
MGKYVTKTRKLDEKRVVSVRIKRALFESFKGASKAAQKHGYSISLAGVLRAHWRMRYMSGRRNTKPH